MSRNNNGSGNNGNTKIGKGRQSDHGGSRFEALADSEQENKMVNERENIRAEMNKDRVDLTNGQEEPVKKMEVINDDSKEMQIRENSIGEKADQGMEISDAHDETNVSEVKEGDPKGTAPMEKLTMTRTLLSDVTNKNYGLNNDNHTIALVDPGMKASMNEQEKEEEAAIERPNYHNIRERFERLGPDKKRKDNLGVNLTKKGKTTKLKKMAVQKLVPEKGMVLGDEALPEGSVEEMDDATD